MTWPGDEKLLRMRYVSEMELCEFPQSFFIFIQFIADAAKEIRNHCAWNIDAR